MARVVARGLLYINIIYCCILSLSLHSQSVWNKGLSRNVARGTHRGQWVQRGI